MILFLHFYWSCPSDPRWRSVWSNTPCPLTRCLPYSLMTLNRWVPHLHIQQLCWKCDSDWPRGSGQNAQLSNQNRVIYIVGSKRSQASNALHREKHMWNAKWQVPQSFPFTKPRKIWKMKAKAHHKSTAWSLGVRGYTYFLMNDRHEVSGTIFITAKSVIRISVATK